MWTPLTPNRSFMAGMAHLGGVRMITAGLSFISGVIVARALPVEDFGVYSLLIAVFAYLAILSEGGTRAAAICEASGDRPLRPVLRAYLTLRLLLATGGVAIALVVLGFWYTPSFLTGALIMASVLVIPLQADWILLAKQKYGHAAWAMAARPIAWVVLIALAVTNLDHLELPVLALLYLLAWAVAALVSWGQAWTVRHDLFADTDSPPLSRHRLLALSLPVLGMNLAVQALMNADLLWVGAVLGTEPAGIYALAFSIITAGVLFANALGLTALARYPALRADPQGFQAQLRKDMTLIIAVAVSGGLGLLLLGPPLLPLIFGAKYVAAIPVLIDFLPYFILYHATNLYQNAGVGMGLQHRLVRAQGIPLLILPGLLWLAGETQSLEAFAMAKAAVMALSLVLMHYFASSALRPRPLLRVFAFPLGAAAAFTLIALTHS